MTPTDSAHWVATRGVWGGVAVASLDVRRVMEAAAARQPRLSWRGRWLLRWLVRLMRWREGVNRWGQGGAGTRATRSEAQAEGQRVKS
jgi:hypothetical protein